VSSDPQRQLIRHLLATLAYRTRKRCVEHPKGLPIIKRRRRETPVSRPRAHGDLMEGAAHARR